MRVGVVYEIERCHGGDARLDFDNLNTRQHQGRPQQVRKLAGKKQGTQGDLGCDSLGTKSKTKMPDEHDCSFFANDMNTK